MKGFIHVRNIVLICFLFLMAASFNAMAQETIVLRLVGVNPSKTQSQKVVMKTYLPEEVKPEDVLDRGDLELFYDDQRDVYYVSGEYDVEAGGTVEEEVEIRDIWKIPQNDIDSLKTDAQAIFPALAESEFKDKAEGLKKKILKNIEAIEQSQRYTEINPQRHISRYRENRQTYESIESDLMMARSLMGRVKPISSDKIWKVFLWILGFLLIMGVALYFIWNKQIKIIDESDLSGSPSSQSQEDQVSEIINKKKKKS